MNFRFKFSNLCCLGETRNIGRGAPVERRITHEHLGETASTKMKAVTVEREQPLVLAVLPAGSQLQLAFFFFSNSLIWFIFLLYSSEDFLAKTLLI